ncbi:hypothetical protein NYQ10_08645 [Flavobacterium johnsoniae]|uniref:hypothetical protein n=1 Tax=Flavobacterium johnsoniae TaxID=986 RepID=UPI0025AEDFF3|nr:hypothetical protein [Flavobacterium johnsoniae]WJS96517.1 hypothetical protein NYQ10_08645 [Flavobacterium johnsoniae]
MKKLLLSFLLTQCMLVSAQTETLVTPNGKKVKVNITPQWELNGNTNNELKKLGTKDAFDLPVITNDTEKMRITTDGQVLINTDKSLNGGNNAKLQINNGTTNGALQIVDGTQGEGRILTSDANGVATWVAPIAAASFMAPPGVQMDLVYDHFTYSGRSLTLGKGSWIIYLTDRTGNWTPSTANEFNYGELVAGWSSSSTVFTPSSIFANAGHSCVSTQIIPQNKFLNFNYVFVVNVTKPVDTIYLWYQILGNVTTNIPFIYNGNGDSFSTAYGSLIAQKLY